MNDEGQSGFFSCGAGVLDAAAMAGVEFCAGGVPFWTGGVAGGGAPVLFCGGGAVAFAVLFAGGGAGGVLFTGGAAGACAQSGT